MIPTNPHYANPLSSPAAGPGVGERALMRAVLEEAIHCIAAETGPKGKRSLLAVEARAWVADDDLQWPFSFTNLCDNLGLSVEALRERLLVKRRLRLPLDADGADIEAANPSPSQGPAEQNVNDMIRAGHPLRVVAAHLGISMSKASILSAGLASRMKGERDEGIRDLQRQGWTNSALAARFRLSRGHVLRICARHESTDGARTAAA